MSTLTDYLNGEISIIRDKLDALEFLKENLKPEVMNNSVIDNNTTILTYNEKHNRILTYIIDRIVGF